MKLQVPMRFSNSKMKVAIMQPYFLPYIGYFQLMQSCEIFVLYDNVKYTKRGWINRNRFLLNGSDSMFSLPLAKGSDALEIRQRQLAESFEPKKIMSQFEGAYRKAPYYKQVKPYLTEIINHPAVDLFGYLLHSIKIVARLLDIRCDLVVSSTLDIDHTLRCEDKVLAICEQLGTTTYINSIGGKDLYDPMSFEARGIDLRFLHSRSLVYPQYGQPFVPNLSIVDVLMFNPLELVRHWVCEGYDLELH